MVRHNMAKLLKIKNDDCDFKELVLPPPVELFSFAAIPAPDVQEVIHIDDDSDEDSDGVPEPVEDLHNDADYMVEDSNAETDGE